VLKRTLIVLAVLLVIFGGFAYIIRANAEDPTEADAFPLSVPVIVTPSLQIENGDSILYKATNVSEGATNFRLMFYTDESGVPTFYKDYTKVGPGRTVSYVYQPPMAKIELGEETIEAPSPVRATFAPIPATGDPGVIRHVVANVQVVRIQKGATGSSLETRSIVPLSHCNFEPRSLIPYTAGRWYWNCAPDMYPLKTLPPQSN
jgi:hypothetical protein